MEVYHLAGSPPCRHCGGGLVGQLFDAGGRITVPRYYDKDGRKVRSKAEHSVPAFKGYTEQMKKDGVTAPPAVLCPTCDSPDPNLTADNLDQMLGQVWDFEQTPPAQLESD